MSEPSSASVGHFAGSIVLRLNPLLKDSSISTLKQPENEGEFHPPSITPIKGGMIKEVRIAHDKKGIHDKEDISLRFDMTNAAAPSRLKVVV
jgi:hypothetical protein